jgi:hypothetical protein
MAALLKANQLDLRPVTIDRIARKDFATGMELLKTGEDSRASLRRINPPGPRDPRPRRSCLDGDFA